MHKANSKRIYVPKVVESLTMRTFHSLKNRLSMVNDPILKYRTFHSQFGEDRFVYDNIALPERGVFVDVGAGHPSYLSNTYFFEQNGWMGLCIDADPSQFALLQQARSNVEWAAISEHEGTIEFSQAAFATYSSAVNKYKYKRYMRISFKDTIHVPSHRLETILKKYKIGHIDILSLDIEGMELNAWRSFDYEAHKPTVVIIEYSTFGLANNCQLYSKFFSKLPYRLVHTTCTNFIFLHTGAALKNIALQ